MTSCATSTCGTGCNQAFPLGVPENLLEPQLKDLFAEALIEIQRWVACYQFGHTDVFPACSTYWKCGTTSIVAPKGEIFRAYTVARRDTTTTYEWCCPVPLNPASQADVRQFAAKFSLNWRQGFYEAPQSGIELPLGFDVPTKSSDSIAGRALTGIYALDHGRLVVAPWLQTYEAVVVEWSGIKTKFSDEDILPDDPDFLRLIRLRILYEYGRHWATEDLGVRKEAWDDALADAIVTCQRQRELHGEAASAEERTVGFNQFCSKLDAAEDLEAPDDASNIVLFGSWGTADDPVRAVAEAVAEYLPASDERGKVWIQTTGDNVYGQNDPAVAMSPYSDYIERNRLALALGEGDSGPWENEFAQVPAQPVGPEGHSRWYERVVGPVSFFVFSGTTGKEASGTWIGSAQHRAMTAAITRSTSRWKVAVVHQDPITSGSAQAPGAQGLSWVSDLEVHAVVSGNSKNYERIRHRGRWHFVVGTGGETPLEGFVTPPVEGSEVRIESTGFLVLKATCDELRWEFHGGPEFDIVDEGIIDVIPPPLPPGPPMGLFRIYTGRADVPTMGPDGIKNLIAHDIRALPLTVNTGDVVQPGYYFIAVDKRITVGTQGSAKPGFMVGQFEAAMASPGQAQDPFGDVQTSGYWAEENTVDGLELWLFRFANKTAGSLSLLIQ